MSERFWIDPKYVAMLTKQGLCGLDAAFAWQAGDRLDKPTLEDWRQRWRVRIPNPDGTSEVLYLKRFDHPRLCRQMQRWLEGQSRRSTAGVECDNARQLAAAGINATTAVAYGERMVGPWERRSFLLLGEVPGEALERWVPAHMPPLDAAAGRTLRRRLVDRLADFVAAFHQAGFVHRDLYLSHVFVRLGPTGQPDDADAGLFALIDLQRVFRPRWRHRRWVVKDLAALDFSTPADRFSRWDRLRFLCRYVRACDRFGSARELARLVAAKADRMRRRARGHNARRALS